MLSLSIHLFGGVFISNTTRPMVEVVASAAPIIGYLVLKRHRPDFIFYLAGADPFEGDRLGRLKLTIDGLRARDEVVLRACARAGLPVAITMSGGYANDISAIVTIHANTIQTASREKWPNTFAS